MNASLAPQMFHPNVASQLELGRRAFFALTDFKVNIDETLTDVVNVNPTNEIITFSANLTALEVVVGLLVVAVKLLRDVELLPCTPTLADVVSLRPLDP